MPQSFQITAEESQQTLGRCLRAVLEGKSWSQVHRLIATRQVTINGDLCLDPARRLKEGETVTLLERPALAADRPEQIRIRYVDDQVVVVEKPAGLCSVRHPAERDWNERRKKLNPVLDELVASLLSQNEQRGGRRAKSRRAKPSGVPRGAPARLRIVHRLDKATSGLVVFARSVEAERGLGRQFARHTVDRRYLAIVVGTPRAGTIRSRLVRDRGDGRRGSTSNPKLGKEAITHVTVIERLPGHSLVACRLETGRTHQIRIHLAEQGHPVCGENVYVRRPDGSIMAETSGAPRLALHAAELGFSHPKTGMAMHWTAPLPDDLEEFLKRLRRRQHKP